jgi:hypothetical protein
LHAAGFPRQGGGGVRGEEPCSVCPARAKACCRSDTDEDAALGEWETISFVSRFDPQRAFACDVTDPQQPSASWWFELEPGDDGVRLRHGARMGPGLSGLTLAISAMPREGGAHRRAPPGGGRAQHRGDAAGHSEPRRGRPCRCGPAIGVPAVDDEGVELVREAERLGADSVWVPGVWAADAFPPAAYLAASTSTIRLPDGEGPALRSLLPPVHVPVHVAARGRRTCA